MNRRDFFKRLTIGGVATAVAVRYELGGPEDRRPIPDFITDLRDYGNPEES